MDLVPPPGGDDAQPLEALIFNSHYDAYKGVVAYVRVFNGHVRYNDQLLLMATKVKISPVEIGIFAPNMKALDSIHAGDVGYVATGLKTVSECRVGDTITFLPAG